MTAIIIGCYLSSNCQTRCQRQVPDEQRGYPQGQDGRPLPIPHEEIRGQSPGQIFPGER